MNKITEKITAAVIGIAILCSSCFIAYALGSKQSEPDTASVKKTQTKESTEDENENNGIQKNETVYVLTTATGDVKKIIVSDFIKNTLNASKINDRSELSNIENQKGDEGYTLNGNGMTVWDADGNDIYYGGDIDKELPVNLRVSYYLDGKNISSDEIAGKSGKVTVRFDYENKQYETVNINGKDEKIYVPFVMLTGMLLDNDRFENISVTNGKMISDGDRTAVIGFALPGLQSNLALDKSVFDIPSYVEITADAVDFELGITVTVAANDVFSNIDTSKLDSLDTVKEKITELAGGVTQLVTGSETLYSGLETLLTKSNTLISAINTMYDGVTELKDAGISLDSGAVSLKNGISDLYSGLNTLKNSNSTLTGGATQIFDTLLQTATTQITNSGITVPNLTKENYSEVLSGVIASLDDTSVYNKVLSEVTKAVEANRAVITESVTTAVRQSVAEALIPIATNNTMTRESYEAAKAASMLPEQTVNAVEAAIDAKMQEDEIKATISQNVEAKISSLIAENMASDEVKAKLQAASDGAKSVIALKSSLDSYNTFYLGLQSYTTGVATAADGASTLLDGAGALQEGTSKLKSALSTLYDGVLEMKNSTPALQSGVSSLKDGAMQLSGGLKKLYDEGISEIEDFANTDLTNLTLRIKATVDVSKSYRNFSGIEDDTDGSVKFIYRTDEISNEK